uniref:Uncharacterized protein n=1 Tax=Arundo donax TaxID=35708 RepID=A0A0A9F1I2_ARUDO
MAAMYSWYAWRNATAEVRFAISDWYTMLPVPARRACKPSAKQCARRCVASPCGVACCLICLSSSVALRRSSVATACAQWMSKVRRSTTSLPPRRPLAFPFPALPVSFLAASSCMAMRSFCICSTHISWEGIMTLSNMSRAASSSPSTALCLLLLPPSISSSSSSYGFLRPRPAPPAPGTTSTASFFFTLTATASGAGGARAPALIPDASLSSFWKSPADE